MNNKQVSRRDFLKASAVSGAVFSLGFYLPGSANNAEIISVAEAENYGIELNAWIHIETSGKVTIFSHRSEMGQGVYQAIPQIIAEELEVNLADIHVVFAKGNLKRYGSQNTGGSSTIREFYKILLNLGASAREMLLQAAAGSWGVSKSECYAQGGYVFHKPSGRIESPKRLHYGQLVEAASKLTPPKDYVLKKRSEYKLVGKPLLRLDTPFKTNGTAVFGMDKVLPGMLYAAVERNPRLRGKVKSFDDSQTWKIPGIKHVIKVKMVVFDTYREGIAVVADSTWAAMQGKKALKIEWDDSGFEHLNSEEIYKRQNLALQTQEGLSFKSQGEASEIISASANKIDVVYETPYQYHGCMEPMNCTAYYQEDKLEIWGPTQNPDMVQEYISKDMNIAKEKIIVNLTFLGGGFGRKSFMDYPHEAAVISRQIKAPVQVVWTREDDATQGPFRPGISYRCEGVIKDGKIDAFKYRMAGQNNMHWLTGKKDAVNGSTSEGFLKPYYETIKNLSIRDVPFATPIPTMWWRSVYASTNGFAFESFMDELAADAGRDPLDFRRAHLNDERLHLLIDKMENVSGWKDKKKGEGYGTAITECFSTTVGEVVKVSRQADGSIKIDQVWVVMDCGWYVNPDTIRAQIEGSIVMGLGAATMHEVRFIDGKAVDTNFSTYQMPRITDIPPIQIHIMENDEVAGGVGEPALPPFAPALTNAIFDLTGKRIRKLPFSLASV
ncbi:molybdopterin cofactor-binding domain-containing protein [Dyadobacter psychrotolerans]|uniref:Xanthine dehydrogenase family protein molybdopterin-binding subunit n=1 Tax=Dyadobacter psychrotolerans TaxID=2541721 RepID=A0A4V2Z3N6_9BACT|nr:molybdopterin cofactor-binding domain-containing protein [Dyadobacter psychrotolerans]TDE13388.1 xanthine dehydrogenase family protein molybdopterin-binding subunit [Dyadobacter psychrotolerans]